MLSEALDEAGVAAPVVADASVVLTELVGNAIRHAAPPPDGQLQVQWRIEPGRLRIEVSDGGSESRPHLARRGEDATGGRGLMLVQSLADAWGVRKVDGVSTVWTVLSL